MVKKLISAALIAFSVIIGASAAGSVFPVSRMDSDGVLRYGYLDENGTTILPFSYANAGDFAECGLAVIEDEKWQSAVIDRQGKIVIPYMASPLSVEFSKDMVAYRYADHSVYYTLKGETIGSYAGAVGFFEDGLLLCKSPASGLYSYLKEDGTPAFESEYRNAGVFQNGRALVRSLDDTYIAIDTEGKTIGTLSKDITPAHMTIYGKDTLIVTNGTNYALYSIEKEAFLTDFLYNKMSEFREDVAMVREANLWGLIDTNGNLRTKPCYYYLSYMGDDLYAARSTGGAASAVDADGNVVYRTPSYVGGFNELKYGLSWHGMENGDLIFFKKNGGYFASLKNADTPTLLSENVVRVIQDNVVRYINISTGKLLFEQPDSFDLDKGITAKTIHYERFFGFQPDGSEYGWNVDFPEINGLPDKEVQKKINAAIQEFFLNGPSVTAEYDALEGGYGVSLEGSVIVVWANCISGKGNGSSVWNNSLAFDINTGKQYKISDLLVDGYVDEVEKLLPQERPMYLYSFPRMSKRGVTYYYNEYQNEQRRAYTEEYLLTFDKLGQLVDRSSECYKALHTPFVRETNISGFRDVGNTHWAVDHIVEISQKGIMKGDTTGYFRPDDDILGTEVCATIARSEGLKKPAHIIEGIEPNAWYANEVSAMHTAGLLEGLALDYKQPMVRADAMQIFANMLVKKGKQLPDEKTAEQTLSGFADGELVPVERRAAVALCVQEGLIQGAGGKIDAEGHFTRAQFAKLLILMRNKELN